VNVSATAPSWVIPLAEADPADSRRLGGKGASLATMSRLGLPVPPAFILTTDLCTEYLETGQLSNDRWSQIEAALTTLEANARRGFGDVANPLLVSVRSGAPVSMPGMMDTILNVGLSERTLPGLVALTGDEAFAWDSFLRLGKMFGTSVRGVPAPALAAARIEAEAAVAGSSRAELLRAAARATRASIESESGAAFPEDPRAQLREAVEAVLCSWQAPRAKRYRRHAGIDESLGTAVVVQAMVFGNLDRRSGSGVAFTRDPSSGEPRLYGDFLIGAQGEDVVGGERDTGTLDDCRLVAPSAFEDLVLAAAALERDYVDMCDIEFTVERGQLWVLQARVGQRTGQAEVRIAADLLEEGAIDVETALARISPAGLLRLTAPVFSPAADRDILGRGVAASPGAAVGVLVTDSHRAEQVVAEGAKVILVRPETSPDDISGFIAASGIVSARGGSVSHAAVVARGLNRPAVCGVEGLEIVGEEVHFGERVLVEGDELSVDGSAGQVIAGSLPLVQPRLDPNIESLLAQCDERRRMPLLSPEAQPWADGEIELDELVLCRSPEQVEAAPAGARLLIDPGGAEDPEATLAWAAERGEGVAFVLVDEAWPAKLRRLPAGPWAGIVAGVESRLSGRLLAAGLAVTDSKERDT
jgi:pyruvate,orthophosphate dikinase